MDIDLALFINAFALIISVSFTKGTPKVIDARGRAISRGVEDGIAFANFKAHKFSYLNISSLASDYVLKASECGTSCVNIPSCFSFNLAAFSDINGNILCELLPSDKYNNSEKFDSSQIFHHFSIGSLCISEPCQNNGTCISLYEKNSYSCLCANLFTGRNCQTEVDACASNPCLNNGSCTDRVNGFDCRCAVGFTGQLCQTDIDVCASDPCKNSGTCIDRNNGYDCVCAVGFFGPQCATGEYIYNSAIIGGNPSYLSQLLLYLQPNVGNNAQWVLCYRASTHGWESSTFHERCDGRPNTVTIVKVGDFVFGGYTDIPWEASRSSYSNTPNAFIYSLKDKEGLAPFKSITTAPSVAIFSRIDQGPSFGQGHDIHISNNANSNQNSHTHWYGSYYPLPSGIVKSDSNLAGTYKFTPDDYEVFYVNGS